MRLTAMDMCNAIGQLSRDRAYHYINPRTRTQIAIARVGRPEGPIVIRRFDPSRGESLSRAPEETISPQMIWRVANALAPGQPANLDRVLGASYNTRSALEALLAHTPQFYYCYPGRIELINSSSEIRHGHKHLIWLPDMPHIPGVIQEIETRQVISEIPSSNIVYDSIATPPGHVIDFDDQSLRRHAQMQVALIRIGHQLGFSTWIAQNDHSIIYGDRQVGQLEGVLPSLRDVRLFAGYGEALQYAQWVDCIWFKNHRLMPAVIEVEHTTGVTSGLTRMKSMQDALPRFQTRYVIVAPDEDRQRVLREASRPQFGSLSARFFPYSAVEELYDLCRRRRVRGVSEEFLDCYMEEAQEEPA